ncbi:unnamed protein product [Owenia fusiformis]|uniref:Uncharacterized protein n=1 Tax=Owenia fusiformis TaxID=6347 RepID=A0A8J1XLB0_OWEFU|nr:unnamed protein product [Owenia fusiformis]
MMSRLNQMIVMMLPAVMLIGHQSSAETTTPEIPDMIDLPPGFGDLTDVSRLGGSDDKYPGCIVPLRFIKKKKKHDFDLTNGCCVVSFVTSHERNRTDLDFIQSIECFSNCEDAYTPLAINETKTCVKEEFADTLWDELGLYGNYLGGSLFCSPSDNKCLSLKVDTDIYFENCCSFSKKLLGYSCKSYKKCKKQSLIK